MLTPDVQQKLQDLKAKIEALYSSELARLRTEHAFLTAVLKDSLGGSKAIKKSELLEQQAMADKLTQYVG